MTLDGFIAKYLGRGIDFDKHYGFQCVDLYRQYLKDVLNVPQSPSVRGAADIWFTYRSDNFERIPNTPLGVPRKGDIIIWNRNMGGGAGHVAVYVSGNVMRFRVFEQDGLIGNGAKYADHSYRHVLGWLRPRITPVHRGDDVIINEVRQIVNTGNLSPLQMKLKIRALVNE